MLDMRAIYDRALAGWSDASGAAKSGATTVYDKAKQNPKATTAIMLGTTLAAAALWVLKEPERLAAVRKGITGLLPNRNAKTARVRTNRSRLP
ncbi:MAG TPA: hypothetical protein VHL85_00445 [Burkholderiales bacterium]|mgnify:CR=1 FL=1|jgi:hypothetical protein|nr:hypothetical protein [Burkholderiales bacterium]